MERNFFINWAAIVEEAKQRRKEQRLTQVQLAKMAKVSTPTISRFESGEKDIQLSTAMNILAVLGMNDQRVLIFSDKNIHYDYGRLVVIFNGRDGDKAITCAVSKEVLDDYFGGSNKDPLKVFQDNCDRIEHEARRKYLANQFESDGSILIKTNDL